MKKFMILCFCLFIIEFGIHLNKRINLRKSYLQEKDTISVPVKQEENKQEKIKKSAENKKKLPILLKKVKKNVDSFDDREIYLSKSLVNNYKDECSLTLIYLPKEKRCLLFWNVVYYSDGSWLFVKKFSVKADDKKYNIDLAYGDVSRDNSAYSIWEKVTLPYAEYKDAIEAISNSKSTTIRFYGEDYYADRKVNNIQINALKDMIEMYNICQNGDL